MIDTVLQYLYGRVRLKGEQTRFYDFLDSMNNPEKELTVILIAGTNGKGSTANYLTSVLIENDYNVGTFTSPHLVVHNDRIKVNNKNISDEKLIEYYNRYQKLWDEYNLSMFEIDLFMAIIYFKELSVDICVVEAGIGARFDVTNCLIPIVSLITNVSYDHQELLGNTIKDIAYQKAGIIKQDVPVFTTETKEEAIFEIKKEAHIKNSNVHIIYPTKEVVVSENDISFIYKGNNYILSTLATYQVNNATLALSVVDYLNTIGYVIEYKKTYIGLQKSNWAGRFEVMSNDPLIIIDGAHNVAGIQSLIESLRNIKKPNKVLFSAMADKDYDEMLNVLSKEVKDITITSFNMKRVFDIDSVNYPSIRVIDNYIDALSLLIDEAKQNNECLVITGSLYFISEVRNVLLNK